MHIEIKHIRTKALLLAALTSVALLTSCADAEGPKARDVNIPSPQAAEQRRQAINERPDPVQYLPLGDDVLLPEASDGEPLPSTIVGPFELRSETLAGALQLVLDGTNIPVSFETTKGLENTITVTNLKGPLNEVVQQICGLADLYCSYEKGVLNVKDTEIFTVSIPPIAAADQVGQLMTNVSGAIAEITGSTPITDPSSRTIVYRASARTSDVARRYFQRLRQNTALIVFETYIWEVSLNAGNSTGINWDFFENIGQYNLGISLSGSPLEDLGTPVSIGLPTKGPANLTTGDVLNFISNYGAVKTISQPQITVLAGSEARLRVADTQNYLASVSRTTTDGGTTTTSTTTDSVDSGFTLVIGSNWDNATVYGNINILLQEVRGIERFVASPDATIQLPTTSERELQTQVRVRPGDSLLIAGLVRERDTLDTQGPGMNEPILPSSRTAQTDNVELVFLLRPRVVVFTQKRHELAPPSFPVAAIKAEPVAPENPALPPLPPVPVPAPVPEPVQLLPSEKAEVKPVVVAEPKKIAEAESVVEPEIKKVEPVMAAVPAKKEIEPVVAKAEPVIEKKKEEIVEAPQPAVARVAPASGNSAMEQEQAMMPKARRIAPSETPETIDSKTAEEPAPAIETAEPTILPSVKRIQAPSPDPVEKTSLQDSETDADKSGAI